MKLHELSNTPGSKKRAKRLGRGEASGLGKTAGTRASTAVIPPGSR